MARDLLADPTRDVPTVAKTLGVGKSTLYRALQASRNRNKRSVGLQGDA
jgi:DNA-binding phage protein